MKQTISDGIIYSACLRFYPAGDIGRTISILYFPVRRRFPSARGTEAVRLPFFLCFFLLFLSTGATETDRLCSREQFVVASSPGRPVNERPSQLDAAFVVRLKVSRRASSVARRPLDGRSTPLVPASSAPRASGGLPRNKPIIISYRRAFAGTRSKQGRSPSTARPGAACLRLQHEQTPERRVETCFLGSPRAQFLFSRSTPTDRPPTPGGEHPVEEAAIGEGRNLFRFSSEPRWFGYVDSMRCIYNDFQSGLRIGFEATSVLGRRHSECPANCFAFRWA